MDALSGLKLYYPSAKDECEEGVEFVTKVNDIFDALWLGTISMTLYSISLLEYFL